LSEIKVDNDIRKKIDEIHDAITDFNGSLQFVVETYRKALQTFSQIEDQKKKFKLSKWQLLINLFTFIAGSALTILINFVLKGGG
jgi:uncharacterized protein YjcR